MKNGGAVLGIVIALGLGALLIRGTKKKVVPAGADDSGGGGGGGGGGRFWT